jgi:hypothetical protein
MIFSMIDLKEDQIFSSANDHIFAHFIFTGSPVTGVSCLTGASEAEERRAPLGSAASFPRTIILRHKLIASSQSKQNKCEWFAL